jgi:hypothetical protein
MCFYLDAGLDWVINTNQAERRAGNARPLVTSPTLELLQDGATTDATLLLLRLRGENPASHVKTLTQLNNGARQAWALI